MDVRAHDGAVVTVSEEVVVHVSTKHSEVLSLLDLDEESFFSFLCEVLKDPSDVFVDSSGSKYFLKRVKNLYLNVVVDEGLVRTAYLISLKTHSRMKRRKWLRRLY